MLDLGGKWGYQADRSPGRLDLRIGVPVRLAVLLDNLVAKACRGGYVHGEVLRGSVENGSRGARKRAALAQLVEHRIRNAEVVSSSLTSGTIHFSRTGFSRIIKDPLCACARGAE